MKPTVQQLAAVMADKTDEQLQEMFAKRSLWTPEALSAARAELARRAIPLPPEPAAPISPRQERTEMRKATPENRLNMKALVLGFVVGLAVGVPVVLRHYPVLPESSLRRPALTVDRKCGQVQNKLFLCKDVDYLFEAPESISVSYPNGSVTRMVLLQSHDTTNAGGDHNVMLVAFLPLFLLVPACAFVCAIVLLVFATGLLRFAPELFRKMMGGGAAHVSAFLRPAPRELPSLQPPTPRGYRLFTWLFVGYLGFSLGLMAALWPVTYLIIDNASEGEVRVELDSSTYRLFARSYDKISLRAGLHRIRVFNAKTGQLLDEDEVDVPGEKNVVYNVLGSNSYRTQEVGYHLESK